jgi:excisionase family DNA binding protein
VLTVSEAASRTGRNPETIRRWIRSGRLAARNIGSQHVIEEAELEAAIAGSSGATLDGWKRTFYGDEMPDVIGAIRRSRAGH